MREFLNYYPEYRHKFQLLRNELHSWTVQLWKNYKECFVEKIRKLSTYPFQFKPHIWELHQIYLNELREKGAYISKDQVIKYVNNLHPAKLMFAVNYNLRIHKLDIRKNTSLKNQ